MCYILAIIYNKFVSLEQIADKWVGKILLPTFEVIIIFCDTTVSGWVVILFWPRR